MKKGLDVNVYSYIEELDRKYPKLSLMTFKTIFFCIKYYLKARKIVFGSRKSVLFSGQAYYNAYYLSRELREIGWKADVLNWDGNPETQIYYHGEDFKFETATNDKVYEQLVFYIKALLNYDIFHFSNAFGISFGSPLNEWFFKRFGQSFEIHFLKKIGKRIVYSNNGCLDGVSKTAFSKWGTDPVCNICIWKNDTAICNDEKNLSWGRFRNTIADYQCLFGGNRADYNDSPQVHERPEFYCLNETMWHPDISIPEKFKFKKKSDYTIFVYHAVGNKKIRTNEKGINIKSSHVYLPLIDKLNKEGFDIELISPEGVSNKDIRYYQIQCDIFLDMLTYGWYGATAREAMMLGKPVICYIRPEWLQSLREELPECAEELPIVSATPETIEIVLKDLLLDKEKRLEIGKKSREFSLKWHSDKIAAKKFDTIYSKLLAGDMQYR